MVDSSHPRYVQLIHLPTLKEIDHEVNESTGERILGKAVALQLKPMNAEISKFAFDYLMLLIEDQLNDMIGFLHRSSNIQRRELIAKVDLQLFLEGFKLSPADLDLQCQISQHYGQVYGKELQAIHSLKETISNGAIEDDGVSQEVANSLIPPNNPLKKCVPKWLPALPPDHTYKFTPQYNHPITEETLIRRKIVDEGKQSEVALLHLLKTSSTPLVAPEVEMSHLDEVLAIEESTAIFGNKHRKRRKRASNSSDLISKLPQSNFSVEEYARNRVELARHKVVEYEENQLRLQQNPFIKYSNLVYSTSSEKTVRRQINKEINSMLRRSLYSLVKSIPKLQASKQEARKAAEEARDERLRQIRAQREQRAQDNEQLENGDINLLDLGDNSDDFFNYSGSDNDDQEPQAASLTSGEAGPGDSSGPRTSEIKSTDALQRPVPSTQGESSLGNEAGEVELSAQSNTEHAGKVEGGENENDAGKEEERPQEGEEREQEGKENQQPAEEHSNIHHDDGEELGLDNTEFLFGDSHDFDNEEIEL